MLHMEEEVQKVQLTKEGRRDQVPVDQGRKKGPSASTPHVSSLTWARETSEGGAEDESSRIRTGRC